MGHKPPLPAPTLCRQAALADIAAAEALDPWAADAAELRAKATAAAAREARGGRADATLAARMLRGLSL